MWKRGDLELLGLDVKLLDIVALVPMGDHKLSDLPERNVIRMAPVVEKSPPADAQIRLERFRRVIQSCILRSEQVSTRGRPANNWLTCMNYLGVA